jgi:hypothetical protein
MDTNYTENAYIPAMHKFLYATHILNMQVTERYGEEKILSKA